MVKLKKKINKVVNDDTPIIEYKTKKLFGFIPFDITKNKKDKFVLFKKITTNLRENDDKKKEQKIKERLNKVEEYNILKPKNLFDFKRQKNKVQLKKEATKTLLISMRLVNNMREDFIIGVNEDRLSFNYNGGVYIIDRELMYFNNTAKLWALDYHENFILPIREQFNYQKEIKAVEDLLADFKANPTKYENIKDDKIIDVINKIPEQNIMYAYNPFLILKFIVSKIIEKIIQAQMMKDVWDWIKLMIIILLCMVGGNILISIIGLFMGGGS